MKVVRAQRKARRCTVNDEADAQARLDGVFVLFPDRRRYD